MRDWEAAYRRLSAADGLAPDDYDELADAAWWTCRVQESVTAWRAAYAGFLAASDERRAAAAAWMIFYENELLGRTAVAAGWLRRARRHLANESDCAEQCLLAWTDSDGARDRGDFDAALAAATRMTELASRCDTPDLVAAGTFTQGAVLFSAGRAEEGMALVDEALCAVLAGELSPVFTGWIYCLGMRCGAH